MYIVGRQEEKEILEDCLESKFPEFLAVCGRRRVGKTYLIREYFGGQFAFYYSGIADASRATLLKE